MDYSSRIPGFYKLSLAERHREVSQRTGLSVAELKQELLSGGLAAEAADKLVENVVGTYRMPFSLALNVRVNGVDRLAPMVVEEPSVVAAASNAARMIRGAGGFETEVVEDLMTTQVQLFDVLNCERACSTLWQHQDELLKRANHSVPSLVSRGGGARSIDVRNLGQGIVVVHVHVDCQDAMGANLVNTIAETIGPRVAELGQGKLGLRILTNLCDRRRVRVRARVRPADLISERSSGWGNAQPACAANPESEQAGQAVVDAIEQASRFAEVDPYRAATHNKGIMNGIDSIVIATGNDYRAVEAGAHAYAAREGSYRPLATWRRAGTLLEGSLELPLALGTVGGTLRVHPSAQLALKLTQVSTAAELSQLAAAVGLASNLAALRALATEGIQRGHMSLHARSLATAAGAVDEEVEKVALALAAHGNVTAGKAKEELVRLRAQ